MTSGPDGAPTPTRSPFGPDDEIGMLNLIDPASMHSIVREADAHFVFDLAVELFVGMPSWAPWGDPPFQSWMTATPRGSVNDDTTGRGLASNELVSRSSDAFSMFTHCGTHVDALNHFGYRGAIWNCFHENDHLGARGWNVAGANTHPPVVARGILIDVAGAHAVEALPDNYAIRAVELEAVLRSQQTELRRGDVVLVRTGRMSCWPDPEDFADDEPGLDLSGAKWLAEAGAMLIGADNLALEAYPSETVENWSPVHTFLLAEAGVPIMEVVDTQALSGEQVFEFAFVGACLRIRGATGAPIRPLAFPLRK
jgi:kynurenine formamidase